MSARYPLQPLLDLSGLSMASLRELCPMSGQTYRNARTIGLTEDQADRWACKVGLVPWLVWPHWLEDALLVCADEKCGRRFVPPRRGTKFCSAKCARRVSARNYERRRYATDPAYRAAKNERSRIYKEEARQSRLVKQRAYYRANRDELLAKRRERYQRQKAAA